MVKAEYLSPETRKMHKSHISARIVRAVRDGPNPGRFLKRDGRTGRWSDVGDRVAFRKTGQALREKAPQFRMVRGQSSQSAEGGGSGSDAADHDAPPSLPPPLPPRMAPLAHHPAAYPASAHQAGHPGHPGLAFASAAPPSAGVDAVRAAARPTGDYSAGGVAGGVAIPGAEDGRKPAPEGSAGADGPTTGHPGR